MHDRLPARLLFYIAASTVAAGSTSCGGGFPGEEELAAYRTRDEFVARFGQPVRELEFETAAEIVELSSADRDTVAQQGAGPYLVSLWVRDSLFASGQRLVVVSKPLAKRVLLVRRSDTHW